MPAFKLQAKLLAEGLAAQHGIPPHTPAEPPINIELAKIGQKLAGKDGGFSCTSCHAVGAVEASEVFESEGINLAKASERLLPEYYRRWLRNPASIDPQTKMPLYFDGGKSQLSEILEGDADRLAKVDDPTLTGAYHFWMAHMYNRVGNWAEAHRHGDASITAVSAPATQRAWARC